MPRVTVNGLKFYYQQAGRGPDVVLLHGVTGNMAIWPLINLINVLAADFRVTAYDLRGHGYSDTPPTGYTSADMADDLRGLQEALDLGPSYLLGHSFGGVVAMHAAVLYPDMVAGLVLSDPYFPGLHHLEGNIGQWSGWPEYKGQCDRAGLEVSADDWFDVGNVLRQAAGLTPEKRVQFEKEVGGAALQRLVRLAATTCGEDVKTVAGLTAQRMVMVRQPILALYGEHSPFLATCRFLEENLPDCRVALVPGGLHRAHEENGPAYVELVRKHLRDMAGIEGDWNGKRLEPVGGLL
jgi:pimeloyl-ACP methyl ester carboxylesterase